jgi:hypothetical protein
MLFDYLKTFFKSIYRLFTPNVSQTRAEIKDNHIGGLSFVMNNNKSVDISCYMPETDNMSSEQLVGSAENYANLLLYINEGLLMQDIIKFIQKTIDTTDSVQDKLFLENVLVFWGVLYVEQQQKFKYKHNQPVIRPLAAFHNAD